MRGRAESRERHSWRERSSLRASDRTVPLRRPRRVPDDGRAAAAAGRRRRRGPERGRRDGGAGRGLRCAPRVAARVRLSESRRCRPDAVRVALPDPAPLRPPRPRRRGLSRLRPDRIGEDRGVSPAPDRLRRRASRGGGRGSGAGAGVVKEKEGGDSGGAGRTDPGSDARAGAADRARDREADVRGASARIGTVVRCGLWGDEAPTTARGTGVGSGDCRGDAGKTCGLSLEGSRLPRELRFFGFGRSGQDAGHGLRAATSENRGTE
mmetsp:Transcript_17675/g.35235  ORF Transcript_17675/g.35235 Transcript_17675/m.35235 type:complete len:266 (-) Transcript_17675:770-1567(-)